MKPPSVEISTHARPGDRAHGSSRDTIGFWMAVALVIGNMIGSGIFLLPASLAPYGGVSLVGWVVSAGGAVMLALVFARLARVDPAAGGPYAYTRRAFGDLPAFLVAWGYWISMWTTLGALAVALVAYLGTFLPVLSRTPPAAAGVAVGTVWLLIGVNIAGVRTAGWVQVATTVLKLLPLVVITAGGIVSFTPSHFAAQQDWRGVAVSIPAVVTLTLWAFLGLESATVPSGSIRDPARTIPRATVTGTLLTAAIYIASTVGVMSLLAPATLAGSTAPFADAAAALAGSGAAAAVALGAAISCFGALNGWTLLAGQLPLAVARDGLFPAVFARVSRRGTPAAGMIIAGVLTTALISLNYTRGLVELFTFFILLSTLNTLVPYVFSSLAVFLIADGPPIARLSGGAGLTAALAFVYSIWAIAGAGQETVYWGFLLLVLGLPVYVAVRRHGRTQSVA
ncbi:MAG TPA: amino acid permease [Vicinamibacterales bacterium]|nr:amino acid permease [Vicinamibacterales bacterium]